MCGHTDPVSGAVDERLPQPGRDEDVSCGGVHRLAGDTRPGMGHGSGLRLLQYRVGLQVIGGGSANRVGARGVRAVPRRHRAPDVHDHGIPYFDHSIRDIVVGAGAVRAGRHDHEIDGGVALGQNQFGDVRTHFAFCSTRPQKPGNLAVYSVDSSAGLTQGLDLPR